MSRSFTPLLRERLAAGAGFEDGLSALRAAGASPIETIKAIREVRKTDLGEAKRLFAQSPAWKDVVDAAEVLHEELSRAVENEKKPNQPPEPTAGLRPAAAHL